MSIKHSVAMAALAASLTLYCHRSAGTTTFDFTFNTSPGNPNTILSPGTAPIVGTGSFTFANDPGNGTFAFSTLGAYSMSFSFTGGASYNQTQINSVLSRVEIELSGSGATRRLQFSDTGSGSGGSYGGSLDLTSGGQALSFEPSYYGQGLNEYFQDGNTMGDYLAVQVVPEPATFTLAGLGAVALMVFRRRK